MSDPQNTQNMMPQSLENATSVQFADRLVGESVARSQPNPPNPTDTPPQTVNKRIDLLTDRQKKMPLSNFEQDENGQIIFREGKPVMTNGRPRKPKPGDLLADGTVYRPGGETSKVQTPPPGNPQPKPQAKPAPGPTPGSSQIGGIPNHPQQMQPGQGVVVTQDESLGRVIIDGTINTVKGVKPEYGPTSDEENCLRDYGGRVFGGIRVSPFIALAIVCVAWMFRIRIKDILTKPLAQEKPTDDNKQAKPADQAQPGGGDDGKRQDVDSKTGDGPISFS